VDRSSTPQSLPKVIMSQLPWGKGHGKLIGLHSPGLAAGPYPAATMGACPSLFECIL